MAEVEIRPHTAVQLKNQVAVVTGAGRGIGEAIARRLGRMGARVVLVARDQNRLTQVKGSIEEYAGTAVVMPCDLADAAAITELGERIKRECGRCDILVNNAAIGITSKPLIEMTPEEWDQIMHTNLRAPYLIIRALAPPMIAARCGHIINISSLAGKNPLAGGAAYSASKWGLNGLTYSVAEELRQYGIRVSVIAPGSVNTGFGGSSSSSGGKDRSKLIQPADVAEVVGMLVTQAANSFISEVLMRPTMKP